MIDKIKKVYQKHGQIIRYLVIGGITTGIDLLVFGALYSGLKWDWTVSKTIATVLAVAFAFAGNKWVVFRSGARGAKPLLRELLSFCVMRALTYVFSIGFLHVTIDLWQWAGFLANLLCNVVVIALNYVFSRFLIFQGGK